jgi:hypothetical protein
MEKPADQMLRSMCQFLASSDEEKLAFLPRMERGLTYMYNECGDGTDNPLIAYCSAVYELMDRYHDRDSAEFSGLIRDIAALVSVMFELGRQGFSYLWYLDKTTCPVSGEVDRLWSVLRRLAIQALAARGWPRARPEIPFDETGWSGVRQPGRGEASEGAAE